MLSSHRPPGHVPPLSSSGLLDIIEAAPAQHANLRERKGWISIFRGAVGSFGGLVQTCRSGGPQDCRAPHCLMGRSWGAVLVGVKCVAPFDAAWRPTEPMRDETNPDPAAPKHFDVCWPSLTALYRYRPSSAGERAVPRHTQRSSYPDRQGQARTYPHRTWHVYVPLTCLAPSSRARSCVCRTPGVHLAATVDQY